VTNRREKKEPVPEVGKEDEEDEEAKAEVEEEVVLPLKGIFCQSPLTGACGGDVEKGKGGREEGREGRMEGGVGDGVPGRLACPKETAGALSQPSI